MAKISQTTDRTVAHREKMARKAIRNRRHDAWYFNQLERGVKIKLNYSLHPKGKKRTRAPIYA